MQTMATAQLKEEHQAILRFLKILDRVSAILLADGVVSVDDLEQMLDFIRTFADRCHHGKEEDLLFGAMIDAGIPKDRGPIGVMLSEHELGRQYVRGMAEALSAYKAGDQKAAKRFAHNAQGYTELLSQHIAKEDNILYPMADNVLSAAQQVALCEGFEKVESERIGPGRHEAFHILLNKLEVEYLK